MSQSHEAVAVLWVRRRWSWSEAFFILIRSRSRSRNIRYNNTSIKTHKLRKMQRKQTHTHTQSFLIVSIMTDYLPFLHTHIHTHTHTQQWREGCEGWCEGFFMAGLGGWPRESADNNQLYTNLNKQFPRGVFSLVGGGGILLWRGVGVILPPGEGVYNTCVRGRLAVRGVGI